MAGHGASSYDRREGISPRLPVQILYVVETARSNLDEPSRAVNGGSGGNSFQASRATGGAWRPTAGISPYVPGRQCRPTSSGSGSKNSGSLNAGRTTSCPSAASPTACSIATCRGASTDRRRAPRSSARRTATESRSGTGPRRTSSRTTSRSCPHPARPPARAETRTPRSGDTSPAGHTDGTATVQAGTSSRVVGDGWRTVALRDASARIFAAPVPSRPGLLHVRRDGLPTPRLTTASASVRRMMRQVRRVCAEGSLPGHSRSGSGFCPASPTTSSYGRRAAASSSVRSSRRS